MKAWGTLVLGIAFGAAVACGSSDDQPPGSGGTGAKGGSSGKGGKGGGSGGKGGSSAGEAGEGATGGSNGATGGNGEGGAQETGGTTNVGGSNAMGGESGDAGAGGSTSVGGSSGAGGSSGSSAAGSGGGPVFDVTFNVHTSSGVHAISPLIYGVTPFAGGCSVPAAAHFTLCRLGSDRWSSYDWENNASNAGGAADAACFVNDGGLGGGDTAGAAVTDVIAQAKTSGTAALVTLPIIDHVAADKPGGQGAPDCTTGSFVADAGQAYLTTHFRANTAVKGSTPVYPPDTTDANVYSDEFVAHLRDNTDGATVLFGLDNEPGIWDQTNGAAHPAHSTYAEVVAKNVAFAKSTRDNWPTAAIAGYVGYGYNDFINLQTAPDASGNGLFVDYYLTNLAQASATYGSRLIDYFDVHWFPEIYITTSAGPTRITSNDSSPDFVAARVQAPRSLWDETYIEDSWIRYVNGNQPIRLVPWLKERIAAGYPGTKLGVSAWSYGGGTDVSGAIAAADALGIFGQQDVGMAAFASQTGDDPYVLGAFEAFRNYDGAGAGFGDTSVAATSDHVELASVYASVDSANSGRVVLIAINRSATALSTKLAVDDTHVFATADVYTITSAGATPAPAAGLTAQEANTFVYSMPAYSVSVLVPKP